MTTTNAQRAEQLFRQWNDSGQRNPEDAYITVNSFAEVLEDVGGSGNLSDEDITNIVTDRAVADLEADRPDKAVAYATDQRGALPPSPFGIWIDRDGWFWIDTQDGTGYPFRVLQLGEDERWHTLDDAVSAGLRALTPDEGN